MTSEERELLARLFEAYALSQDPNLPPSEHFRLTFEVARKAGIVEQSYLLPGPAIPARGRTLAINVSERR